MTPFLKLLFSFIILSSHCWIIFLLARLWAKYHMQEHNIRRTQNTTWDCLVNSYDQDLQHVVPRSLLEQAITKKPIDNIQEFIRRQKRKVTTLFWTSTIVMFILFLVSIHLCLRGCQFPPPSSSSSSSLSTSPQNSDLFCWFVIQKLSINNKIGTYAVVYLIACILFILLTVIFWYSTYTGVYSADPYRFYNQGDYIEHNRRCEG